MKSVLVFVSLISIVLANTQYLVPYQDEEDRFDGFRKIPKSFSDGIGCDGKWPKNTPSNLKDSLKKELSSSKTMTSKGEEWEREREICNDKETVEIVDLLSSKLPLNDQNPCKLADGNYTWVITNDWEITFGHVINNFEWGVKHKHLANCRALVAGGEWKKSGSETIWNLESGTFSSLWSDSKVKKELEVKLSKAFETAECKIKSKLEGTIYKKTKTNKGPNRNFVQHT